MRVVILAVGSRGDVQPYLALGRGLLAEGWDVRIAASREFEELARAQGLDFAPLAVDAKALLEGGAGHAWLDSGENPVAFFVGMLRLAAPMMARFLADVEAACADADVILYSSLGHAGYSVAEQRRIPCLPALVVPGSRTAAFPSVMVPGGRRLGPSFNRLSHRLTEQAFWQPFRPSTNRWRVERLGLKRLPVAGPYGEVYRTGFPFLYGFSPTVVPVPPDWPRRHHVTGYWFLDRPADWTPPPALADFLADGPPPVYVGFGSMTARDAARLTEVAVDGLRLAGRRGVLLSGWAGLAREKLPDHVVAVDEVPHDWLFPRMAAVVHHGGAGTTAAGFRAGVPAVVCPVFADQPFWGRRVASVGAGPGPIPRRDLTPARLAAAIRRATEHPAIRDRAAAIGERVRAERGVEAAVRLCRHYVTHERALVTPRSD